MAESKRKGGRPRRADRKVLAQQTGVPVDQVEPFAQLVEEAGLQQSALDMRLVARFKGWRRLGFDRQASLERAGAAPELYSYQVRKAAPKIHAAALTGRYGTMEQLASSTAPKVHLEALAKAAKWKLRDPVPADLIDEERPVHVGPDRVSDALTRLREALESEISFTFRHLTHTRRLPLRQAVLETCRICGLGPGREEDGRGEGLSETVRTLKALGFAEVAELELRSPRASRAR